LESGQPVVCTFYVRTQLPGVVGTDSMIPSISPPIPSQWFPTKPFQFTAPTVAKFRVSSFTLRASYDVHSASWPLQVKAPIPIKPGQVGGGGCISEKSAKSKPKKTRYRLGKKLGSVALARLTRNLPLPSRRIKRRSGTTGSQSALLPSFRIRAWGIAACGSCA